MSKLRKKKQSDIAQEITGIYTGREVQADLQQLGNPDSQPSKVLDRITVGERISDDPLTITLNCTEFTCRCPVTDQPDWARIRVIYVAKNWFVESKSFKLYLETYRNVGIFHEHLAIQILEDFVTQIVPSKCTVTVFFNSRGGIAISAKAHYQSKPLAAMFPVSPDITRRVKEECS